MDCQLIYDRLFSGEPIRIVGGVAAWSGFASSTNLKRKSDGYWEISGGLIQVVATPKERPSRSLAVVRIEHLKKIPDKVTGIKFFVDGTNIDTHNVTLVLEANLKTDMKTLQSLPNLLRRLKNGEGRPLVSSLPTTRLTTKGLAPLVPPPGFKRDRPSHSSTPVAGPSGGGQFKRVKVESDRYNPNPERRNKENSENQPRTEPIPIGNFYGENKLSSKYFPPNVSPVRNSNPNPKRRILENKDQVGWKESPDVSPLKPHLQGFSNLGNTCYMNAILQSLFILEPFAKEIWKSYQSLERHVDQNQLFMSFTQLLKNRDNPQQSVKDGFLRSIKEAISVSATRFSGFSQHDAHEFLCQVLDQLKEEIATLTKGPLLTQRRPNPVTSNFEFSVCHGIKCSECGNVVQKEENFSDLSLDMPSTSGMLASDYSFTLQDMLDAFFRKETVSYRCEQCPTGTSSEISHKFTKLSRVLILHLKRYVFNTTASTNLKIANHVVVPKFLTLGHHCAPTAQLSAALTDSVKKVNMFDSPFARLKSKPTANLVNTPTTVRRQLNFTDSNSIKSTPEPRKSLHGYKFKGDVDSPTDVKTDQYDKKEVVTLIDTDISALDEEEQLKLAMNESLKETHMSAEEVYERQLQEAMEASLRTEQLAERSLEADTDTVKENLNSSSLSLKSPTSDKPLERSPSENQSGGDSPTMTAVDSTVLERSKEEMDKIVTNYSEGDLPQSFRLVGVVSHIGSSTSSGHYITDVWESRKNGWVSFDDSTATLISEEDVLRKRKGTGYIFFYMAKDLLETPH